MIGRTLFRGKCVDNGEWAYGYFVGSDGYADIIEVDAGRAYEGGYHPLHVHSVIPETVSQWTGLIDKTGVKIFEGDIVRTEFGRMCIIKWFSSPAYCGWDLKSIGDLDNIANTKTPRPGYLFDRRYLEVVSNKWEDTCESR